MKNGKKILKTGTFYILGGFIYAFGLYFFAKNADFAPGGVSGLALMAHHLVGAPIGLTTLLINIPLMVLSYRIVGKKFIFKSVLTVGICTVFLDLVFPHFPTYSGEPILAVLYSGICTGAGIGIFFMCGASSGGTDYLTAAIKMKKPHLSVGSVTMFIDFVIISLGWLVFGKMDAVLYGLIYTFACSFTMDKILCGVGAGKLVIIVSQEGSAIARLIGEVSDRGSTMIRATGSYSGEDRTVLLCACTKPQAYEIQKLINHADQSAFVMVTDTSDVFGEGFKRLDGRGNLPG